MTTPRFTTVGDVKDYLSQFPDDMEVILNEDDAGEEWHDQANDLVVLETMMDQFAEMREE